MTVYCDLLEETEGRSTVLGAKREPMGATPARGHQHCSGQCNTASAKRTSVARVGHISCNCLKHSFGSNGGPDLRLRADTNASSWSALRVTRPVKSRSDFEDKICISSPSGLAGCSGISHAGSSTSHGSRWRTGPCADESAADINAGSEM